jgi:hypothetical protein
MDDSMRLSRYGLAPCALVFFLVGTSSLSAKEQKVSCDAVPAPVRAAFEKAFSKATINECVKDVERRKTTYEIVSTEGEINRHVRFHPDGKVMEVEEPIAIANVPEPAKRAVQKKYPKGDVTLVEKVTRGEQVVYEFRVKNRKKIRQILLDADGKKVKLK